MTARKLANTKTLTVRQWQEQRRHSIGGSDIAAILGFNKYRRPITVWMEKRGEIDGPDENFKMKMGHLLEPIVARLFSDEHQDITVIKNNFILQHEQYDFMTANLDRKLKCPIRGRGVLEIKTAGEWSGKEWQSDTVPDAYMFQIQWYMAITGYKFGYLAVLIGGNSEYKSYLVERDDELIAYMMVKAIEFWGYVEAGERPPLTKADLDRDVLSLLYPSETAREATIDLSPRLGARLKELDELKAKQKEIEAAIEEIENEVRNDLGEHTVGILGSYTAAWKPTTRTTLDAKAVKANHPDIYDQYVRTTTSRRLTISSKDVH